MACDLPPAQCLTWHLLPHIPDVKSSADGRKITAPCPAHNSHRQGTLTMQAGDRGQRIVWHCHKGCDDLAVRAALIDNGIQPACLPVGRKRQIDLIDQINGIIRGHGSPAEKLLRIAAAVAGYKQLPDGAELEHLAGRAGIHRATAYRARGYDRSTISRITGTSTTRAISQRNGVSGTVAQCDKVAGCDVEQSHDATWNVAAIRGVRLTADERSIICRLGAQGIGNNEIARRIGRSQSTVSRYLTRIRPDNR